MKEPCSYLISCRGEALYRAVIAVSMTYFDGSKAPKPVYLMGTPLCHKHCQSYSFSDWMTPQEWLAIQENAREKGYLIPTSELVSIQFQPVDWQPNRYFELDRT